MLLRPEITDVVGKGTLITGVARSGTTIMGNLVGTLSGVEYIFEPPLLYSLFSQLGKLDKATWRLLFESYLFEDFLMDALAGRRMNMNRYDDSSIRNVKSELEIDSRLDSRYRRRDLFEQAVNHRIAFKMPDVLGYLPLLLHYYPRMKVVVMFREPEAVVASVLGRHWLDSGQRMSQALQGPWVCLEPDIPFWVPLEMRQQWICASEIDQAYMYYLIMNEALLKVRDRVVVVDYDEFIRAPTGTFHRVADYLEAEPTPQTATLLETVTRNEGAVPQTLGQARGDLRERALAILGKMGYTTVHTGLG